MLKLFRDRPLLVGDVRTGTIRSLLPSQKHYLKVYSSLRSTQKTTIQAPRSLSDLGMIYCGSGGGTASTRSPLSVRT
ncbi:MAG: hypothetical protein V1736_00475 [Pseudomonadota bacterium]